MSTIDPSELDMREAEVAVEVLEEKNQSHTNSQSAKVQTNFKLKRKKNKMSANVVKQAEKESESPTFLVESHEPILPSGHDVVPKHKAAELASTSISLMHEQPTVPVQAGSAKNSRKCAHPTPRPRADAKAKKTKKGTPLQVKSTSVSGDAVDKQAFKLPPVVKPFATVDVDAPFDDCFQAFAQPMLDAEAANKKKQGKTWVVQGQENVWRMLESACG